MQWIQGNAVSAETSFFKINSQGTPLDETEELLIKNRRKPIAIAARAILRAGSGHKYWSAFGADKQAMIENLAASFYKLVFEPESETPLKTLDVPLGGSVSPVDALALLLEFLSIAGSREPSHKSISGYVDDESGDETVRVLSRSLEIVNRVTGNSAGSLGLHPAIYFYNEKWKYSRFLFLGMSSLLTEKIRNNDSEFFKRFTRSRRKLEEFLVENKSLITNILQNLGKTQRVPKLRSLFGYLIDSFDRNVSVTPEMAIAHLGLRGRIFDVAGTQTGVTITDETKSMVFVRDAIRTAMRCPICEGLLDSKKSVSYDHKIRVREGGNGDCDNVQMVHPFCNTGVKG